MSIQTISNSISTLDREIHNLENQIQTVNNNINRKEKEAHSMLDKINKEKNLTRIISLQKDLSRKNEEINRLNKDKSSRAKTLSDKQAKKLKYVQDLNKEEQKERDKVKKEQKEMLSLQQSITREMEKQKTISLNSLNHIKSNIPQTIENNEGLNKQYDVFVSHASEDKDSFVRPFVQSLQEKGIIVWYDESELRLGDSLRRSIDKGLNTSKYGIVVLSEAFFKKEWPQRELDGLFAREVNGEKVILPLWHKISKNEVMRYSPIIADMLAINTTDFTIDEIAGKIAERIKS
jgi:hypothetical protein